MCNGSQDHDHEGHGHACSPGEEYERNIAEQRKAGMSRRQLLTRMGAAGLLIAGNAVSAGSIFASGRMPVARQPRALSYISWPIVGSMATRQPLLPGLATHARAISPMVASTG